MNDRYRFRAWNIKHKIYHYNAETTYDGFGGNPVISKQTFYGLLNDDNYIVEQCVGLKDKNDKLIYDNDLIMIGKELYRVAIDDFGCRTVILDNNPFKEVIEWSDIVKTYYFHNRVDEIEVVGNIRENKDLLENKDE